MNQIIKSTAHVVLFLMVDATDFVTAETGVSATVQVSKAGGTFANTTNSATEIANGWYKVTLTTTETGTEGELVVRATGTGCAEWRDKYIVVDAADYMADVSSLATSAALATVDGIVDDILVDTGTTLPGTLSTLAGYVDTEVAAILAAVDTEVAAIKAKTDNLPADPADDSDIDTQLAAIAAYIDTEVAAILAAVDTEVAAIKAKTDNLPASPAAVGSEMALADGAITAAKIATDAITAAKVAADAVTEIQSGLATAAALDTVDGIVDDILVDTGTTLPAAIADVPTVAEFEARTLAAATYAVSSNQATIVSQLITVDGIVDNILADTNELQTNQGNWLTATGFSTHSAADVWAAGTRTLTAGTNLNDITAADVWAAGVRTLTAGTKDSEIDAILADTNELQTNQGNWLTADVSALATAAALATVDGIVDSILADTNELQLNQGNWTTADVSGLATAAALATVDTVVDSILEDTGTTLPATLAGLATSAALATVDGIVDSILADTAELQTNQGNWTTADVSALATAAALATVDTVVDTILADTAELQTNQGNWLTADVSALATSAEVAALNNLSAAQVWAALGDTEKNAIADAVLSRGVNNVEDTADALSLTELVLAAFESAISGVTWTIYKSDHATAFQTRTVTVDADADPIVEVAGGN